MRNFLELADVTGLVEEHLGARATSLDRLRGGTKKGVYRLGLADGGSVVLYHWTAAESYWPPSPPTCPDDPFVESEGPELLTAAHAELSAAGVRVPALLAAEPSWALVEDVGTQTLEGLMEHDPVAAEPVLAELGETLRRMQAARGPHYGKLINPSAASTGEQRPTEDVILDRALAHLAAVSGHERLSGHVSRIEEHLRVLHAAVPARRDYGLVHGELGPDHVIVTPAGEPALIDIEGTVRFDAEWEHAWARMRFAETYGRWVPIDLDPDRLEFYRYAQVLSLIEGPLRIAGTDFPDRQWMLDLADWNITKALGHQR